MQYSLCSEYSEGGRSSTVRKTPLKAPIHGAFLFSGVQQEVLKSDAKWEYVRGHGVFQWGYPLKDLRDRALATAERKLIAELWANVAEQLGTALF